MRKKELECYIDVNHFLHIVINKVGDQIQNENMTCTYRQIPYGKSERLLVLPYDADTSSVRASLHLGSLHILLQRREIAQGATPLSKELLKSNHP